MKTLLRCTSVTAIAVVAWLFVTSTRPVAEERQLAYSVATGLAQARELSASVDRLVATGDLRLARAESDTMLPWYYNERLYQYYKGVRVFGGDMTRNYDDGRPASVFGQTWQNIDIDVQPSLNAFDAKTILERVTGVEIGDARMPSLVILPRENGSYVLSYVTQVFANGDLTRYFVDANTGEIAYKYSNKQTQSGATVGNGTGVYGDSKKMSVFLQNGSYTASDKLRPPSITTYDMKGDYARSYNIADGTAYYSQSDIASTTDNRWTDGAVVDAHVYMGYVYDYYFKRMGRRGLDDHDRPLRAMVHPIYRTTYASHLTDPNYQDFYINAFWDGYEMVFGDGLPSNVSLTYSGDPVRYKYNYFSGGLDTVAHELTHGVTDYTSNLTYLNESGALNESFSDIMGTSVEFYFEQRAADVVNNTVRQRADYLIGEDIQTNGVTGLPYPFRSMAKPATYGDPDHYSLRYTGTADNGGVHINSGISNQVYYLAIEGGRNDTSQMTVTGVGPANREQIEKAFYRAFTTKLTSSATFSMARAATIQAARELYGTGSAADVAITQAWNALGVPTYNGYVTSTPTGKATANAAMPPRSVRKATGGTSTTTTAKARPRK